MLWLQFSAGAFVYISTPSLFKHNRISIIFFSKKPLFGLFFSEDWMESCYTGDLYLWATGVFRPNWTSRWFDVLFDIKNTVNFFRNQEKARLFDTLVVAMVVYSFELKGTLAWGGKNTL